MTRIGIFGGAFDPPHIAHQALAQAAVAQFELDELRIIPTGEAWHKSRTLTPAVHRLAMAHLAFDDIPRVCVDAREMQRSGPTYTVDTLCALRAEQPEASLLLFIGADQAQAFTTWHRWQEVLELAQLVVAQRPDGDAAVPAAVGAVSMQWHNATSASVQHLDMPLLAVSATDIRAHIARHMSMPPWLPASVQHYIDQHRLYQTF